MLDEAVDIDQFLKLQAKPLNEIQAIARGMSLVVTENKDEMIRTMMKNVSRRLDITRPQTIPLVTRDPKGELMPVADKVFRKWRQAMLNSYTTRNFNLTNRKGKEYKLTLKYMKCGRETLDYILENSWFMSLEENQNLIDALKVNPGHFNINVIQKPDMHGNTWLMLHVEPRAAA